MSLSKYWEPDLDRMRHLRRFRLNQFWNDYCFHCHEKIRAAENRMFCCRRNCELVFHDRCFYGKAFYMGESHYNLLSIRQTYLEPIIEELQAKNDNGRICRYCLFLINSFYGLMGIDSGVMDLKYFNYYPREILDKIFYQVYLCLRKSTFFEKQIKHAESLMQVNKNATRYHFLWTFFQQRPLPVSHKMGQIVKMACNFGGSFNVREPFNYELFFQCGEHLRTMEQAFFLIKLNYHQNKIFTELSLATKLELNMSRLILWAAGTSCNTVRECVDCFCYSWYEKDFTKVCTRPHGLVWLPLRINERYHWWIGKVYFSSTLPNFDWEQRRQIHVIPFKRMYFSPPIKKLVFQENELFVYSVNRPKCGKRFRFRIDPISDSQTLLHFLRSKKLAKDYMRNYRAYWHRLNYELPLDPIPFRVVDHIYLPSHFIPLEEGDPY